MPRFRKSPFARTQQLGMMRRLTLGAAADGGTYQIQMVLASDPSQTVNTSTITFPTLSGSGQTLNTPDDYASYVGGLGFHVIGSTLISPPAAPLPPAVPAQRYPNDEASAPPMMPIDSTYTVGPVHAFGPPAVRTPPPGIAVSYAGSEGAATQPVTVDLTGAVNVPTSGYSDFGAALPLIGIIVGVGYLWGRRKK